MAHDPPEAPGLDDLRVLLIANDPLVRTGLASLLAGQPGCNVVGLVAADADLAESMAVYRPEVLLWDLGWGSASVSEFPVELLAEIDLPLVILLSDPQQVADVWAAGARCLLLREAKAGQLLAALQAAGQGLVTLDPALAGALLPDAPLNSASLVESLTPRELEVLQLLAEGLPNKTIARRLDISEHTVKFHVNAIMGKLNAHSRTEAVVRATQLGLILF